MQAPTLFIIAADLAEMQVNANIDEADVGRIRPGQNVSFRVDAYPTDNFVGTVTQVRLQPVVVQNVTTYGAVITVPNRELKLKPGMTANVKIEIAKRTNVLRIPNAALRFRPTEEVFAALQQTPPPDAQGLAVADAAADVSAAVRGNQTPAGQQPAGQQASRPTGRRRQPMPQPATRQSASARAPSGEHRATRPPAAGAAAGAAEAGGGRWGPRRRTGAHARALQDDVGRGAAAVSVAHEGTWR